MSKIHTHYDNLKIARNAPDALIKAAYKVLLQQHHPDKVEVAKQAEALRITHIIRGSYDVLSDPVQRAEHDAWIKTQEAQSRSHKPEQPDINVNEAREKEEFRRRETEKAEAEKQRQAQEEEAKNKTGCLPWIIAFAAICLIVAVANEPVSQTGSGTNEPVKPIVTKRETPNGYTKANRYRDNGNGTVKDLETNLEWMRCSLGQNLTSPTCEGQAKTYSWNDALNTGKNFKFAGHSDWRMPTKVELEGLVLGKEEAGFIWTGSLTSPTINTTYFPNTPSDWFWSSSPYAGGSRSAWFVYFSDGYSYLNAKNGNSFVRLVRG
ncbi:MAG: DUF1566 domain-containing protein [Methylococcales bacterium]|nr:DUF1566 domain-containing protein [Methylococcales bacterium]